MDRSQAPPGSSPGSAGGEGQEVQQLKPNAVGLGGVVFMAIATAAPITAMTGNVPVAVGYGNGTGAPAGYIVATVVLTLFAVGYVAMARYITATGAFYGYISHGLGQVVGMASGLLACLAYIVFEASLIGIFSSFAHTTFKSQLGLTVPWQVFAVFMLVLNAVLGRRPGRHTALAPQPGQRLYRPSRRARPVFRLLVLGGFRIDRDVRRGIAQSQENNTAGNAHSRDRGRYILRLCVLDGDHRQRPHAVGQHSPE